MQRCKGHTELLLREPGAERQRMRHHDGIPSGRLLLDEAVDIRRDEVHHARDDTHPAQVTPEGGVRGEGVELRDRHRRMHIAGAADRYDEHLHYDTATVSSASTKPVTGRRFRTSLYTHGSRENGDRFGAPRDGHRQSRLKGGQACQHDTILMTSWCVHRYKSRRSSIGG